MRHTNPSQRKVLSCLWSTRYGCRSPPPQQPSPAPAAPSAQPSSPQPRPATAEPPAQVVNTASAHPNAAPASAQNSPPPTGWPEQPRRTHSQASAQQSPNVGNKSSSSKAWLIPVLIVGGFCLIAFLGIAIVIALPAYQDYVVRTKVLEGLNLAALAKISVSETFLDKGVWPENNEAAGYSGASSKFVQSINIRPFNGTTAIDITYSDKIDKDFAGKVVTLIAAGTATRTVTWTCHGNGIKANVLPANCRYPMPEEIVTEVSTRPTVQQPAEPLFANTDTRVFLYREPIDGGYWNDWYATSPPTSNGSFFKLVSEGKTSSIDVDLSINCHAKNYTWRNATNFGQPASFSENVPTQVVNNAFRIFCSNLGNDFPPANNSATLVDIAKTTDAAAEPARDAAQDAAASASPDALRASTIDATQDAAASSAEPRQQRQQNSNGDRYIQIEFIGREPPAAFTFRAASNDTNRVNGSSAGIRFTGFNLPCKTYHLYVDRSQALGGGVARETDLCEARSFMVLPSEIYTVRNRSSGDLVSRNVRVEVQSGTGN